MDKFANLILVQNEKTEIALKQMTKRLGNVERDLRIVTHILREQKTLFMQGMQTCAEGYRQTLKAAELNIESSEEIRDSMATSTVTQWC